MKQRSPTTSSPHSAHGKGGKQIPVPEPGRLRHIPQQFSWIDQRLVRHGHLRHCGDAPALALYLFLVTVSDARGLSYYSEKRLIEHLPLSTAELRRARRRLTESGLIVYRKLHVFVMVLCYSRMMFLRFTLSQGMEHFLESHVRAFEFFGSVPRRLMIDNLKTGVIEHKRGRQAVFNPRYLELAGHYGFSPVACNVGKGNEKGRVENGVGYVKKNFLSGRRIEDFTHLEVAAEHWRDTVANVRVHGATKRVPKEVFESEEKARLLRPHPYPYDCGINHQARVTKDGRVVFETNTYSVPPGYARQLLHLRVYPEKIVIYPFESCKGSDQGAIATHQRSYAKRQDIVLSQHLAALKSKRRRAREQNLLNDFISLFGATGSLYYAKLQERVLDARDHVRKILALSETYGTEKVRRAIEDGLELGAYRSEYIAHVLESRSRNLPEPGPLHLTRNEDQLELQLPEPDLSFYDKSDQEKDIED